MEMPSGGPEWWQWVVWLLFGTPLLFTKTAAKLPWIFGWIGRKMEERADRAAAKRIAAREQAADGTPSPAVQQLQAEIATLQDGYARLDRSHGELEESVDRLRGELLLSNRRLFAVVGWAQRLRLIIVGLDPDHEVPEPPDLIRDMV